MLYTDLRYTVWKQSNTLYNVIHWFELCENNQVHCIVLYTGLRGILCENNQTHILLYTGLRYTVWKQTSILYNVIHWLEVYCVKTNTLYNVIYLFEVYCVKSNKHIVYCYTLVWGILCENNQTHCIMLYPEVYCVKTDKYVVLCSVQSEDDPGTRALLRWETSRQKLFLSICDKLPVWMEKETIICFSGIVKYMNSFNMEQHGQLPISLRCYYWVSWDTMIGFK